MKYLKKSEVVAMFKSDYLPAISPTDRPAQRAAWCDLVDHLQRDGKISEAKAQVWDQPAFLKAEIKVRPSKSRVNRWIDIFCQEIGSINPYQDSRYLYKQENRAQRAAEGSCNIADFDYESEEKAVLAAIRKRFPSFPFEGFFLNSDPRGYALKFDPDTTPANSPARKLPTDFGGYFILCYESRG